MGKASQTQNHEKTFFGVSPQNCVSKQTTKKKRKKTEDNSREKGVECQQRVAAQRGYPEYATDPMVAPPDYDIRQSGSVVELQNRDFWLRPTDISWHFPILVTIREEPFQELSFKDIREVEGQGRQDRGGQEAEDQEKR